MLAATPGSSRGLTRAAGARQAELVPDEVGAIAAAVRGASAAANVVVTSGGLGPTPDDVTMAGVAAALGHPLARRGSRPWLGAW